MGRLIDSEALLEEMYQKMSLMGASRDGQHPISMETVIDFIKDYPVAYNVDKVVEELEEVYFWTPSTFDSDGFSNDDSQEVVGLDKAIEIVKGGGVNE